MDETEVKKFFLLKNEHSFQKWNENKLKLIYMKIELNIQNDDQNDWSNCLVKKVI